MVLLQRNEQEQFVRYINTSINEVPGRTCGTYFRSNRLMHRVGVRSHNLTTAQFHDPFVCTISSNGLRLCPTSALTTQFCNVVVTFVIFHTWHSTFYSCGHELTPTFQMLNFLRLSSVAHQMAAAHKFRAAMTLSLYSETKPCSFSKTYHYIIF